MDFGSLLSVAQRNAKSDVRSESKKFYSTKFEPPKKESKEKKLSNNIKRFLVQRDEEEKRKEREAKRKYEELMALRTVKDKNKINKMLKVTKSANRSVLEDAVDNVNTAITLEGPEQPDEDDYGYVSHEASSIYKNLMDKYKTLPAEKKFSDSSGRHSGKDDLLSTKDRVRAAILREKEDEKLGRKRSTPNTSTPSSSSTSSHNHTDDSHRQRSRKNLYDPKAEREEEERRRREEDDKRRKEKFKKAPPAMDFQKLLKLAEQKQHEPLQIEVEQKKKEPERLLTNKEKREMEERRAYFAEKERRKLDATNATKLRAASDNRDNRDIGKTPNKMAPNGRIPKLNSSGATPFKPIGSTSNAVVSNGGKASASNLMQRSQTMPKTTASSKSNVPSQNTNSNKSGSGSGSSGSNILKSALTKNNNSINSSSKASPKPIQKSIKPREFPPKDIPRSTNGNDKRKLDSKDIKTREFPPKDVKTREFPPKDVKTREFPPKDVKTREFPPKDVKTREFPPKDVKTREFPPKDVIKSREFPPKDVLRNGNGVKRKAGPPPKRRILDDDSEYDSEMDDFIDDDPQDNDYSKYIKEIFGYDKSRYRQEDDDVDNMESNFAQQQREEFISKKIGLMEDLEDMRLEAQEKKQKAKRRRL